MGYQKILVTLDGSKFAELSLEHMIEIARPNANIHLLSVMADDQPSEINNLVSAFGMTPPAQHWPPTQHDTNPRDDNARAIYLKHVASWLEQLGYSVSTEVRTGNIVETIVQVAQDGFDVLVMVTHGRTGLNKVAIGSVTEGVMARVKCPLFIIPAKSVDA